MSSTISNYFEQISKLFLLILLAIGLAAGIIRFALAHKLNM